MVMLRVDRPEIAELSMVNEILFKAVFTTQLEQVADAKLIYEGKNMLISLMSTIVVEKTEGCLMEMV